jgi:hypothetical protein
MDGSQIRLQMKYNCNEDLLRRKKWFASALQVSIGLIEILVDHDMNKFKSFEMESLLSCVKNFMQCSTYDQYIDLVKYGTTYMHARSLKQDVLPKKPLWWTDNSVPLFFDGSVRRFIKNRMISGSKPKNQHLFWSISQVKRCATVVPADYQLAALHKHRKAMDLSADPPCGSFISEFAQRIDNILKEFKFSHVGRTHEYSTNACWENSIKNGGAKAELQFQHVKHGHTTNDELLKMDFCPYYGVTERRGFMSLPLGQLIADQESERLGRLQNIHFSNIASLDTEDDLYRCRAKVYPVCEPLKIRTITASNARAYAIAKGLQRDIHTSMKCFPQFKLIGSPLTTDDIHEMNRCRRPGEQFASGDFSAATDNLKIQLTKLCFERILFHL